MPGNGPVQFCPVCRSKDIVEAVPAVNLGCLSRIVGWILALLALRFVFGHLDWIWTALLWLFGFLFQVNVGRLIVAVMPILFVIVIVLGGIYLVNPEMARSLNPFPKGIPWLLRTSGKVLVWTARVMLRIVEGKALPKPTEKKRKRSESKGG